MASTWIDYGIITIVIVFAMVFFYKALKEPLDLLFGLIISGIGWVKDRMSGGMEETYYSTISYR